MHAITPTHAAGSSSCLCFAKVTFAPTPAPVPVGQLPSSYSKATFNIRNSDPAAGLNNSYKEAQGVAKNGRLYVFGGFLDGWNYNTKASLVYHTSNNSWTRIEDMPVTYAGLTHMANAEDPATNMIYLAGGIALNPGGQWTIDGFAIRDVMGLDTSTNKWILLPQLPKPIGGCGAVVLNRRLHVISGSDYHGGFEGDLTDHNVLDLRNPSAGWASLAPISVGRNHIGVAAGPDGKIYAIGGQLKEKEGCGNVAIVEAYNPFTNTWTLRQSLPYGIGHITPSTLGTPHGILVVSGVKDKTDGTCTPAGVHVAKIHHYDPSTNNWTAVDIDFPAASRVTGIINGFMYSQFSTGLRKAQVTWTGVTTVALATRAGGESAESRSSSNAAGSNVTAIVAGSIIAVVLISLFAVNRHRQTTSMSAVLDQLTQMSWDSTAI